MPDSRVRVLLDTTIFGELALETSVDFIKCISSSNKLIVYGCSVTRKELRATPKNYKSGGKNFRNALLRSYDSLVRGHGLEVTSVIVALADEYARFYKGSISKYKLRNDFLIVACASIHRLDVLVSEDNHSMFSTKALESYNKANQQNGFSTPKFWSLAQLKRFV
ncbi:MAG: PIN domain-containing protein [Candidatus Micrarchaeota archaeon]